ncbi:MAG TPA: hypothetical protein VG457_20090 [Planctomycetota bacterium]|nr:hypothetical protein [Planctomycetota bacterium]
MQTTFADCFSRTYAINLPERLDRRKGLPPGDYEIEAWHERLGTRSQKKKLDAKGSLDLEFSFASK